LRIEGITVKAYVINLDSRKDRLENARREFSRVGLEWERFPASTGEDGRRRLPDSIAVGGTLGLNASFDRMLEEIAASNDPWVLVFEDDFKLRRSFNLDRLDEILQQVGEDAAVVKLGFLTGSEWRPDDNVLANVHRLIRPRARLLQLRNVGRRQPLIESAASWTPGTQALAIRPRKAAELAVALGDYNLLLDHLIHSVAVGRPDFILQVTKSLVSQGSFTSDITPTRKGVGAPP